MIVASYKCSDAVISIAAMLSVGNSIFYRPKDKRVPADNARNNFHTGNVGDIISLMKVYNAWRETNFSTQWCYEKYIQVAEIRSLPDYEVSTDYLYTSKLRLGTGASEMGAPHYYQMEDFCIKENAKGQRDGAENLTVSNLGAEAISDVTSLSGPVKLEDLQRIPSCIRPAGR
ncbi:hypothetical protein V6N13_038757 [Hibiscus sabdariffa]